MDTVKTTVEVERSVWAEFKKIATLKGKTTKALLEELIEKYVQEEKQN